MLAAALGAGGAYAANPYGIAGTGALTKLGMPSACSEYSWDTLQPSNPINMVRPCKYWVAVGGTHQYWGYHETTDRSDRVDVAYTLSVVATVVETAARLAE